MEISGPISAPTPTAAPSRGDSGGAAWQVGQILKAIAVSPAPGGQTQLQVGNQLVQGQSPIPLQPGQALEVQVQSLQPQVVLRILASASSTAGADFKANAVRNLLPKQDSMAPLLRNLDTLANARQTPLPPLLLALSRNLINQLPEPKSVSTASGLRQAVEQSGLFMEARLQHSSNARPVDFSTDLKANLLRLVQLLRNWPGQQSRTDAPPRTANTPPSPTAQLSTAYSGSQGSTPASTGAATGNPPASTVAPGAVAASMPNTTQVKASTTASTPGHAATLARGVGASTPQPANPVSNTAATTVAAGSGTAPGHATGNPPPLFPIPPAPPLRGQAPAPIARATANLQALDPASILRPELQKQAEAAVSRVQLAQLASLPQERASGMEWLLDLPIRRGNETDVWSLQIRYDQEGASRDNKNQQAGWTVYLAFDLPGLGPMQARVSLRGEEISSWFWATDENTVPYMERHLRELRQHLEDAGLKVAELHCRQGSMPIAKPPPGTGASLLDERT